MKYYIIKPNSSKVSTELMDGIKSIDTSATFVKTIEECNIAVLQKGWTNSKIAVAEMQRAIKELKLPCREGYFYTDRVKAHLN